MSLITLLSYPFPFQNSFRRAALPIDSASATATDGVFILGTSSLPPSFPPSLPPSLPRCLAIQPSSLPPSLVHHELSQLAPQAWWQRVETRMELVVF
jgi:hypothetical protein